MWRRWYKMHGSRYSRSWLLDNLSCCSIAIHCYSLHCHWGESHEGSVHLSLILRFNKWASNRNCSSNCKVVETSCFVAQDAQFPVGGASISRLVNGMIQRMPGSPTMDRILTRHQLEEGKRREGIGDCNWILRCAALHTDLHKRLPDMGWHPVMAALLKTDNI